MLNPKILPRIAIFSLDYLNFDVNTNEYSECIASQFEIYFFNTIIDDSILDNFEFIVVLDNKIYWKNILLKRKNVICIKSKDLTANLIYNKYIEYILKDVNPLISIFTPTFNSFKKIDRVYASLLEQSVEDWEWIIVDDSTDKNNVDYIYELTKKDKRVKLFDYKNISGLIGQTKRFAASLCSGEYLMELDHDDVLHHLALEKIINAFKKYPDSGFCFCSSAEYFDDGGYVDYGNYFGMGYGKHYDLWYKGKFYRPAILPVNYATMRHIVGVPNHFRCWKRSFYNDINRHNDKLNCVDDYELLIRTFLKTKMIRIKDCLYFQTTNPESATNARRAEIQRKVDRIQLYYEEQIHNRIIELGGIDFPMIDKPAQHYNLTYDF
jgi:glycosyltransferase involved in cell wall biosynthesis